MDTQEESGDKRAINDLSYAVIGAAMEVHSVLGPGLVESAYENAMCIELKLRGIAFERQFTYSVPYKVEVVCVGRLDLLVEGKLVVELKAVDSILRDGVKRIARFK